MTAIHKKSINQLPSDITDAVNKLSLISFKLKNSSSNCKDLIRDYKDQLTIICSSIDTSIYTGLLDLMLIYHQGLDKLLMVEREINNNEIDFIAGFPELLLDDLNLPSSKISATILIKYFKNPLWIRPVSEEEYHIQINYLTGRNTNVKYKSTPLEEILLIKNNNVLKTSDKNEISLDQMIMMDSSSEQNKSYNETSEDKTNIETELIDLEIASFESADVDEADCEENYVDLNQFLDADEYEKTESNEVDFVELDQFITVEEEFVTEPVVDINNDRPGDSADDIYSPVLSAQHQELIDLVEAELSDIKKICHKLEDFNGEDLNVTISDLSEQAENIGNAINLIGLEGIGQACEIIANNLSTVANTKVVPDVAIITLVKFWPDRLLEYLRNIYDKKIALSLVDYLKDKNWPQPVNEATVGTLIHKLNNPVFLEEEVEARQTVASSDDVSLQLPDDVNQELLEGLLHDLPSQTEEFSLSIKNICEGGALEDIENAQRVAHTLKGAANVVGVKGIANLTHHLEDILEAQVKAGKLPTSALKDVLMNASDCLEAMTEALLGIDVAPEDALQTLQSVLDYANVLDKEGVPDANDKNIIFVAKTGNQQKILTDQIHIKDAPPIENMLRIPSALADELLRITGESLISTSQVQENIKNITLKQELIRLHNVSLQQLSYDMEHIVDIQGVANQLNEKIEDSDFDSLEMDEFNELHTLSRRLVEIAADSIQLTNTLEDELANLNDLVISQNKLHKESQELVLKTRMIQTKTIIPRIKRGVRQVCRLTGKNVELYVEDNNTYMDSDVLNNLIEPLMHIIRNAIDHGIESSADREIAGKPAQGRIDLIFRRLGDQVVITVEDDGAGLNYSAIKARAISNGLITTDMDVSDAAVSRLILEPGFSTRNEVTQVSGRGIGLDVVSVKLRELKGSVNISSEQGQNCRFELILPLSTFSTHSLLVRVRQYIYAISNRGIEEILYPGLGQISDIGDEVIYKLKDQEYSAVLIDDLLNLPQDRRNIERNDRPVLLVRDESGTRKAVMVQEVLDSRDVVVKPMGQYIPKIDGIAGATVLGDGSIAPVIDLSELLQAKISGLQNDSQLELINETVDPALPYVLVVDDSLSARQSLVQFVEDLGLYVRSARDGLEAIAMVESRKPDLILVDMEMPRMNGLELTSHIRSSGDTVDMPVIMITSRSTDKHRDAALKKGVNHFMVKPFNEDELARKINEELGITLQ